jgi:hypothetical protein
MCNIRSFFFSPPVISGISSLAVMFVVFLCWQKKEHQPTDNHVAHVSVLYRHTHTQKRAGKKKRYKNRQGKWENSKRLLVASKTMIAMANIKKNSEKNRYNNKEIREF